jgi:hypothetical protein
MRKATAGGSGYVIPFQTSAGGGSGATLEDALAGTSGAGVFEGFRPKPFACFGNANIDWTQQPFTDTPQSPMDLATIAMKNASYNAIDDLAYRIFSTGHGDRMTIAQADSLGSNVWKLTATVQSEAARFQLGQIVGQIVANYASIDGGSGEVVGVNDIDGSILIDVGSSGLTPTAGRHIGLDGELSVAVTSNGGVFGYCPPAAARTAGVPGDTFLGVVRTASSNIVAVAGYAFDVSGKPLTQAVNSVAGKMAKFAEATPDTVYVNPENLPRFANETNTSVVYIKANQKDVEVFYSGFRLATPAGVLEVLGEPGMPSDKMLITKAKAWVYATPASKGGKLAGPATGSQLMVPSYDHNVSRVSLLSTGFFGCTNLLAAAVLTIDAPSLS